MSIHDNQNVSAIVGKIERNLAKIKNQVEIVENPLVSVVMTAFNVEDYIEEAIASVLRQSYGRLELIIVDDASNDSTIDRVKAVNDPRVKLYRNEINCGTYYSKNSGILHARGKYIAIHDADDISDEFRLEKQVRQLEANPQLRYSVCQYTRYDAQGNHLIEPRIGFQTSLFRRELFEVVGYFDSVRVAADEEFDNRLRFYFGPQSRGVVAELLYFNRQRENSLTAQIKIGSAPRSEYVEGYKTWHASLSENKEGCHISFPQKVRPFPVNEQIAVPYSEVLQPVINTLRIRTVGEMVTASMVTIPSRLNTMRQVVNSILPQVDRLNVFLAGFSQVPDVLTHPKIKVLRSQEYGALEDNAKFLSNDLTGFHFTIDDDLIYPDDYVKVLIGKLEAFEFRPAIGVHGILINDPFTGYYDVSSRIVYRYRDDVKDDVYVHIIGTGTLAYHTRNVSFTLAGNEETRMIDIYFGLYCQANHIPVICIAHGGSWLKDLETPLETRIYNQFKDDDRLQTSLVQSIVWNLNFLPADPKDMIQLDADNLSETNLVRKLTDWGKQIVEQHKTIRALENQLADKEKEIAWYRAHIDDFHQHSLEYRIKNSALIPSWLFKGGKFLKKIVLSIVPGRSKKSHTHELA